MRVRSMVIIVGIINPIIIPMGGIEMKEENEEWSEELEECRRYKERIKCEKEIEKMSK